MKLKKVNFSLLKRTSLLIFFFIFFHIFNLSLVYCENNDAKLLEQYYLDGVYYYVDKSYSSAYEQFEGLSKNYPYSNYTEKSIIMEAYTNYLDKEYVKIPGIYEVYNKLYPDGKYMAYMLYLKCMSYYSLIKSANNGIHNINEGAIVFEELLQKYPESEFAKASEEKLNYVIKLQQLSDLKIADFLYKNENYIAAMRKYTSLFNTYKENLNFEIKKVALAQIINLSKMLHLEENVVKYQNLLNKIEK